VTSLFLLANNYQSQDAKALRDHFFNAADGQDHLQLRKCLSYLEAFELSLEERSNWKLLGGAEFVSYKKLKHSRLWRASLKGTTTITTNTMMRHSDGTVGPKSPSITTTILVAISVHGRARFYVTLAGWSEKFIRTAAPLTLSTSLKKKRCHSKDSCSSLQLQSFHLIPRGFFKFTTISSNTQTTSVYTALRRPSSFKSPPQEKSHLTHFCAIVKYLMPNIGREVGPSLSSLLALMTS
jgi:hypothetical protein